MKRYILRGGWITSVNDGEEHYVSARKLVGLYRLRPEQIYGMEDTEEPFNRKLIARFWPKEIEILTPRADGNYEL